MSSENSLEYSNSALSVRHTFLETDVVLYVEGENDITFWDERFRRDVPSKFYTIEAVKGKEQLIKYCNGIFDGTLNNIIIACDSDYSEFIDIPKKKDPRIIMTYGYSIENTMFCPVSVANYIRRLSHKPLDYLPKVNEWFSNFCNSIKVLLPYEIVNYVFPGHCEIPPKVFGKKFAYFSQNTNIVLDSTVTNDYISKIEGLFSARKINDVKNKIRTIKKDIRFFIPGHFLFDAVVNYMRYVVKSEVNKNPVLSDVALYGTFAYCLDDRCEKCADRDYIKDQIKKAYNYFNHPNDDV